MEYTKLTMCQWERLKLRLQLNDSNPIVPEQQWQKGSSLHHGMQAPFVCKGDCCQRWLLDM